MNDLHHNPSSDCGRMSGQRLSAQTALVLANHEIVIGDELVGADVGERYLAAGTVAAQDIGRSVSIGPLPSRSARR